jgi:Cys-tRNA synthase (O-phospho-L-seryl-tRNA:Cys-tRNA synthase)
MREEAVAAGEDVLTVLTIFSDSFERVKRWEENVRWVFPFNQGDF